MPLCFSFFQWDGSDGATGADWLEEMDALVSAVHNASVATGEGQSTTNS